MLKNILKSLMAQRPGSAEANTPCRSLSLYRVVVICLLIGGLFLQVYIISSVRHKAASLNEQVAGVEQRIAQQQKRRPDEAAALLKLPFFDTTDVALLSDYKVDTLPFEISNSPPILFKEDELFSEKRPAVDFQANSYVDLQGKDVPIDTTLPAPVLLINLENPLYPEISISEAPEGTVNYYFEFDSSPSFDTSQYWQYPVLTAGYSNKNVTVKKGFKFNAYGGDLRDADGHSASMRFPFSAAAMQAGWKGEDAFNRLALILGHGKSADETAKEVYEYARHVINRATNDTVFRNYLDVFRTGSGGCGHMNAFAGELLERNGIRYRMVSGFNPKTRVFIPGGGHSATEVFLPDTGWSYYDPYLDLFFPGQSIFSIVSENAPEISIYDLTFSASYPAPWCRLTLAGLFTFRKYYDFKGRLPAASMLRLLGREHEYGSSWELSKPTTKAATAYMPEEVTIYVRARYLLHAKKPVTHTTDSTIFPPSQGKAAFSPWTVQSFTVKIPEELRKTQ
ncbi:transglutaminase-like domain-containing protein [Desulfovibrio sp. OttesenSCG-928-G11]|nr:transglutaminase-like domain-containing protein [Desulfovibrio sp. OttesenSCG-928-G11]